MAWVYIKHQIFGLGGSILTPFGVLLLGLSIWKTVEISVSPGGKIEAKFRAIEEHIERVGRENLQILQATKQQLAEVRSETAELREAVIAAQRYAADIERERSEFNRSSKMEAPREAQPAVVIPRVPPVKPNEPVHTGDVPFRVP